MSKDIQKATMEKYRIKAVKKAEKKRQLAYNSLREIIRSFPVEAWLNLLRSMDKQDVDYLDGNFHYKGEFLVLVGDIVLRLGIVAKQGDTRSLHPTSENVKQIVSLFFEYDDTPSILIKKLGMPALPLFALWQNKFNYPPANMLGRMHLLNESIEDEIKEIIGIDIFDLHAITFAILGAYSHKEFTYFKSNVLHSPKIRSLSKENIEKFLAFFSADIERYCASAKKFGIYEKEVGTFNMMNRYPIIRTGEDLYIMPSENQLLESVAANLFNHVLGHKYNQDKKVTAKLLSDFGDVLEQYVIDLASEAFGKANIVSADTLVADKKELRCEVVCRHEKKSLAIEVKKLQFPRDAITDAKHEVISSTLERHLEKASKQIINTMKYVGGYKIGLIVIPDSMISPYAALEPILNKLEVYKPEEHHILICTLTEYEQLMANTPELIFEALELTKNKSMQEGKDIVLVLYDMKNSGKPVVLINEYIGSVFNKKLSAQEREFAAELEKKKRL